MNKQQPIDTANALVAGDKGLLAMDESNPTCNPQGCQVFNFKHLSAQERDHGFLWRTSRCLPERGRIGKEHRQELQSIRKEL
jgi:polyphosphate kinase 2 (PPK2 family)